MTEIDKMNVFRYMDIIVMKNKPKPKVVPYMDDPD